MSEKKESTTTSTSTLLEKCQAVMILGAVGDALGYCNDEWEFNQDGPSIHAEFQKKTENKGLTNLILDPENWMVSDDTIMHMATAKGLISEGKLEQKLDVIAKEYVLCYKQMNKRAAGMQTIEAIEAMGKGGINWKEIAFSDKAGGCGAAMRSMCIGLVYSHASELQELIQVAVESGRMTHHHPTGYLGSVARALFTSLALQNTPVVEWGSKLLAILPQVQEYVKRAGRQVDENLQHFDYFTKTWTSYLKLRGIEDGKGPVKFPEPFGVKERDSFYERISYSGWGGSSGHDCPMIAYDALLGCKDSFEELCLRGVLHGGDSDSTGTMCCAWYGALRGFSGVPAALYSQLEFKAELMSLGEKLSTRD